MNRKFFYIFSANLIFLFFSFIVEANETAANHGESATNHSEQSGVHHADQDVHFVKVEVARSPKDFKIPTQLWDILIEGEVDQETSKTTTGSHGTEGSAPTSKEENKDSESKKNDSPIVVWLPVKVYLSAKQDDILKNKDTEISFGMGGGEINLKDFVTGDKGSFYIKFQLGEVKDQSQLKVYFYSKTRKRKIDGEIFGSGCNVYFDISKKFMIENSKEGIKVNITDSRHISVLGGHFIFVSKQDNKLFVTQVKIVDSEKKEYFCQE